MILHEKTLKEFSYAYETIGVWNDIWCQCDYCGVEFIRSKRNILLGTKITDKLSCKNKECNKKKIEDGNFAKYGVKNYGGSAESLEKARMATRERFGVDNAMQCEEIKQKIEMSCLEKYGHKSYLSTPQCRESLNNYCAANNVSHPSQISENKIKSQKTSFENYGVSHPSQSPIIKEAKEKKSIEKYGVNNPLKSEEVKEKIRKTMMDKFGVEHALQNEEILRTMHQTMMDKFGCSFPIQNEEIKEKIQKTCLEKYGYKSYVGSESCKKSLEKWTLENYGVKNIFYLSQNGNYGKKQKEIEDWLTSENFHFTSDRKVLNGREIDLYNDEFRLGIEFCGLYWHNEQSPQPRNRWYHHSKYSDCAELGIKLITIFEDEWEFKQEQCKNIILSTLGIFKQRIHARKCQIKAVSKDVFRLHCDKFHLFGSNKLISQGWLLVDDFDQVIGGLSLGRHHRKSGGLVLDRMFFAPGIQIIGGASKLFSHSCKWAKENGYNQIISWSDNRWSSGKIYNILGFTLDEEMSPDYSYINIKKPTKRISKQSQQKKKTDCPPGLTEKEWSTQRGLARIWDCGKKRWIFIL